MSGMWQVNKNAEVTLYPKKYVYFCVKVSKIVSLKVRRSRSPTAFSCRHSKTAAVGQKHLLCVAHLEPCWKKNDREVPKLSVLNYVVVFFLKVYTFRMTYLYLQISQTDLVG